MRWSFTGGHRRAVKNAENGPASQLWKCLKIGGVPLLRIPLAFAERTLPTTRLQGYRKMPVGLVFGRQSHVADTFPVLRPIERERSPPTRGHDMP